MATVRVIDSKGECVADALTAQSFVDFKKRCAEEGFGRVALVVTLDCGEEIFMDTCKLFKRFPRGACYTARLLKSPTSIPEGLARRRGMTCGWKLEHQPWCSAWKVARRRVCSTDEESGSSPRRILPAEMAVPFCVLLEGQASSCTEPTATWQRINARGGGEISYRAEVKRRHPQARRPPVVRRARASGTQCKK